MTEALAVFLLDDEGNIAVNLGLCQHVGTRHSLPAVAVALCFPIVRQLLVGLVDLCQHDVVDRFQGNVLGSLLALFQSLDGGCQRVGSHLGLQLGV